jgi:hypothetical protein
VPELATQFQLWYDAMAEQMSKAAEAEQDRQKRVKLNNAAAKAAADTAARVKRAALQEQQANVARARALPASSTGRKRAKPRHLTEAYVAEHDMIVEE